MNERLRVRFWLEVGLSVATGLSTLLTVVWRDWIEIVFRVDPDHHSGSLEWLIVGATAVSALTFASIARGEWRNTAASPA